MHALVVSLVIGHFHRTKSNRPSKSCSACWLLSDLAVNPYLPFLAAVFLPAAALGDFFAVAVFFAAAIFRYSFEAGAGNCGRPSGTQN